MSFAKDLIEDKEFYRSVAKEILTEMGVIKPCFCGESHYEGNQMEKSEMIKLATYHLKEKYGSSQDFKLFDKILCEVAADVRSDKCPYCSIDED